MVNFLPLQNTVQPYSWGSYTAIAELLGQKSPSATPQAELWMGAHPKAPSKVRFQDGWTGLDRLIEQDPETILGQKVTRRFGAKLPFLLKVLAAAQPLSIQAHPNKDQARQGFERENRLGIALTAPDRNYKDDQHKPECLCALTDFWALCGFRPLEQIRQLMAPLVSGLLAELFSIIDRKEGQEHLKDFFLQMLQLPQQACQEAINFGLDAIGKLQDPVYKWIGKLASFYPNDIAVFAPAVLNLLHLQPDQAIYLPAGQLHAYLEGVGIEIMANSDNVLRGGLTAKHMDMEELARVVSFIPYTPRIIQPGGFEKGLMVFETPAQEFQLALIDSRKAGFFQCDTCQKVQILLCTQGQGQLQSNRTVQEVKKGTAVLVPAVMGKYALEGRMRCYLATVP